MTTGCAPSSHASDSPPHSHRPLAKLAKLDVHPPSSRAALARIAPDRPHRALAASQVRDRARMGVPEDEFYSMVSIIEGAPDSKQVADRVVAYANIESIAERAQALHTLPLRGDVSGCGRKLHNIRQGRLAPNMREQALAIVRRVLGGQPENATVLAQLEDSIEQSVAKHKDLQSSLMARPGKRRMGSSAFDGAQPVVFDAAQPPVYAPAQPPAYAPAQPPAYAPAQPPAYAPAQPPAYAPAQPPAYAPAQPPAYQYAQPAYAPAYPAAQPPPAYPAGHAVLPQEGAMPPANYFSTAGLPQSVDWANLPSGLPPGYVAMPDGRVLAPSGVGVGAPDADAEYDDADEGEVQDVVDTDDDDDDDDAGGEDGDAVNDSAET